MNEGWENADYYLHPYITRACVYSTEWVSWVTAERCRCWYQKVKETERDSMADGDTWGYRHLDWLIEIPKKGINLCKRNMIGRWNRLPQPRCQGTHQHSFISVCPCWWTPRLPPIAMHEMAHETLQFVASNATAIIRVFVSIIRTANEADVPASAMKGSNHI